MKPAKTALASLFGFTLNVQDRTRRKRTKVLRRSAQFS